MKKVNWKRPHFILLCSLICIQSCQLYPPYRRPCLEMPETWRIETDEMSTVVNIRWWEAFQDPILNALIQEGLASNKNLRLATARIQEYQARLGIISSQLYPQIGAQGSFSRQRVSQTTAGQGNLFPNTGGGGGGTASGGDAAALTIVPNGFEISPISNDYLAVLTASYELDIWGKIRSATDAAVADLLGQVEARRTVLLTLVSSIANTYILLRQHDRQLTVSFQTLASRQESLKLAEVRFKEGLTSALEVKQAESEVDEAAIQVIRYQILIPQQENLLSILIGHPPDSIPRGPSIEDWQLPPQVPAGLPADLLEQRPDIMQAEDQLIAANARIGEARALYFPALTLTGYYGYESSQLHSLFTDPSRTWQWMINLLQPIFTGGRISSTVDLAKAIEREAYYYYQQTVLNALKEVDDALIAHQLSKEALRVEYERVADLRDYLHLARLQYENGLVDYLNVLDAERRLFAAQLNLAEAQATVFSTLVDLYKALGGGWVIDAENLMKEEFACDPSLTK